MSKEIKTLNINEEDYNILDEKARKYIFQTPNFPPLPSNGKSSPKFINYNPINKELKIVQKNNQGYLIYTLNTSNGDNSESSVGLVWDLIRLKKIQFSQFAYLFKNNYESIVGNMSILHDETESNGYFENHMKKFMNIAPYSNADIFYKNKKSMVTYGISSSDNATPSEINYKLKYNESGKANILFLSSAGSSKNVDILLNGKVIANLDLSSFCQNGVTSYYIYNFDIPQETMGATNKICEIKIRNNDLARTMYICCMNYLKLEDYDGRDFDSFKATSSNQYYINSDGASDYAIYDSDMKKWMGSYHGGETALQQQFTQPEKIEYNEGFIPLYMRNLPSEETYFITPFFELLQVTNLNNKGKMISLLNFNQDGQMDMNFNFYNGNVNVKNFYTGLTCNSKLMDIIKYPNNVMVREGNTNLLPNDGCALFSSSSTTLKMFIGFSKFLNEHIEEGKENGWVSNHTNYNKFYFGAIDNPENPVHVENLAFRKTLICNVY